MDRTLLDEFHDFEVEIPMLIEDLRQAIAESKRYATTSVDYSIEMVDTVEAFYLDVLVGTDRIPFSQNHFDRAVLAYLGEVLIRHAGGRWEMGRDTDFTHGTPMVYGFKDDDGIGFSPVGIRDALIREQKPGTFRESIEYCINKKAIEADLMRRMKALPRDRTPGRRKGR